MTGSPASAGSTSAAAAAATRTVIDIITGTWRAQALHAAVALGIPDHLAAGRVSSQALSEATGASRDALERLIRLLVAMDVFTGSDRDGYGLTAVSERLRRDAAGSLHAMCLLYGEEFYEAWGHALTAVRSGETSFKEAFGQSLPDYLAATPGAAAQFQRAMRAGDAFFADVVSAFDFSGAGLVIDVAGGVGQLLATVLRSCPHARGM